MNRIPATRVGPEDREALDALASTGVIEAARAQRRADLLQQRQQLRARLAPLPAMRVKLDELQATYDDMLVRYREAQVKLLTLSAKVRDAQVARDSAGFGIERLEYSTRRELYQLADPRCSALEIWLNRVDHWACNAFRLKNTFEPRMLFGGVVRVSDNGAEVRALKDAIKQAREDLEATVQWSNDQDVGPALRKIAEAVQASAQKVIQGGIQSNLPELQETIATAR